MAPPGCPQMYGVHPYLSTPGAGSLGQLSRRAPALLRSLLGDAKIIQECSSAVCLGQAGHFCPRPISPNPLGPLLSVSSCTFLDRAFCLNIVSLLWLWHRNHVEGAVGGKSKWVLMWEVVQVPLPGPPHHPCSSCLCSALPLSSTSLPGLLDDVCSSMNPDSCSPGWLSAPMCAIVYHFYPTLLANLDSWVAPTLCIKQDGFKPERISLL